ncbi:hypothetical protein MRBLMI12_000488 [Microbacterium sp. LMI12-1-1.1]|uniref:hypothetical protein n=1 Tax=Microbacterium sp. LMI12-1-1.1 TaxID=3135225 RepID=UPI00342BCB2D
MSGHPDGRSWEQYYADMRAANESGGIEIPPVTRTVLRRSRPAQAAEKFLGLGVRKTLKRVRDAGWARVELGWSRTWVSTEFYAADSAKKPGEEAPANRKGDVKKAAHEERHWWLLAAHPAYRIGFVAHWTEGVTPAGKRSFTFQSASATDPLGIPTELAADYSVDANAKRRVKDEPGHIYEGRIALLEANARRLNREYNTGHSYLNHHPVFKAFKEFEAWLVEFIEIVEKARAQREEAAA